MDSRAAKHNDIAALYDRMRPGYPKAMYRKLKRSAKLTADSRILEIGCGTGQATRDLIKISPHITCVEPGSELLKMTRAHYPNLTFVRSTFEDFSSDDQFDLIFSASAWYWIDQKIGFRHSSDLLTSQGHLAIAYNYFVETDPDSFLNHAQPIFARYNTIIGLVTADQIVIDKLEMEHHGFHVVAEYMQDWQQTYSTDEYIDLRNTFVAHQHMPESDRLNLERDLRKLAESDYNGQIALNYRTVLFVAEKSNQKIR